MHLLSQIYVNDISMECVNLLWRIQELVKGEGYTLRIAGGIWEGVGVVTHAAEHMTLLQRHI